LLDVNIYRQAPAHYNFHSINNTPDHLLSSSAACPRHSPSPKDQQQHPLSGKLRRISNRSAPPAPGHPDIYTMGGGNEQKGNGSSYPLFAERPVGVPKTSILKGRIEPFYKSGQYYKVNLQAYGKPPHSNAVAIN
jgi:alpha-mannosidase